MALTYHFVQVFNSGSIALSERPKLKELKHLVAIQCDKVVTILAAKGDQALTIGNRVRNHDIDWEWVKVQHAVKMSDVEKTAFMASVKRILVAIQNHQQVLIHCSAGLHRTGMFAYCLLIKGGMSHEEAMETIKEIRFETYEALDEKYLAIAQDLLAR